MGHVLVLLPELEQCCFILCMDFIDLCFELWGPCVSCMLPEGQHPDMGNWLESWQQAHAQRLTFQSGNLDWAAGDDMHWHPVRQHLCQVTEASARKCRTNWLRRHHDYVLPSHPDVAEEETCAVR